MAVYGGMLVGGASRRMGRPKALVEVDGVTLAERAAAALAPHVDRLLLLGAGPVPEALAGLERLPDAALPHASPAVPQDRPPGPLAGLLAALRRSPRTAWVLCSCDLPWVAPEAVAWLLAERHPQRLAVIPRLAAGAPPEPLFALYEPAARPAVEALAARGERAPWRLAGQPGMALVTVPPHLARCWRDADTPEELPESAAGIGNRRNGRAVGTP
ncbi:MAG TPA: molybdenum cofactor guanylyltransferase [Thermoanaerobaculia bacterium]|nr:molybdenum cofactor guanylyltransferase [Thermoanaerobaculia bacterium]